MGVFLLSNVIVLIKNLSSLQKIVIGKTLSLEACSQTTIFDKAYGDRRHNKELYTLPLTIAKGQVTLIKREHNKMLTRKLAYLGIIISYDRLNYNHNWHLQTVKNEEWLYWESRKNPTKERAKVHIDLAFITFVRHPWLNFYPSMAKF